MIFFCIKIGLNRIIPPCFSEVSNSLHYFYLNYTLYILDIVTEANLWSVMAGSERGSISSWSYWYKVLKKLWHSWPFVTENLSQSKLACWLQSCQSQGQKAKVRHHHRRVGRRAKHCALVTDITTTPQIVARKYIYQAYIHFQLHVWNGLLYRTSPHFSQILIFRAKTNQEIGGKNRNNKTVCVFTIVPPEFTFNFIDCCSHQCMKSSQNVHQLLDTYTRKNF